MSQLFYPKSKQTDKKWENYYQKMEKESKIKKNYLKDAKIPQPMNIIPVNQIYCINCQKNHSFQEAKQHVVPIFVYDDQPIKSENNQSHSCWKCGKICGQTQSMKSIQQKIFQQKVPYVDLKKIGDNYTNDFDTVLNVMPQKQIINELQPIYQEVQFEKKQYLINHNKPVYYKSLFEIIQDDEIIVKKQNGFIGPRTKKDAKIQYGYNQPQKQTEFVKVMQSYPDTGNSQEVRCGNFCQANVYNSKKIVKKQKYDINPQKARQSNYQFNKSGKGLQDTISIQQISAFQYQSHQNDQNVLCQCKVYMNCNGTKSQTNSSNRPPMQNTYKSNKGFWTTIKKQNQNVHGIIEHDCPLCQVNNACNYCNSKISFQLANKIKQSVIKLQQDKFVEKHKDNDNLQDWKKIWMKIRTWQTVFNQQGFNLCQKDAKSKGVLTLKQWQNYVACQKFH